jgi:release factor glutamine methyltransferase
MKLGMLLDEIERQLERAGVNDPRVDAELLVGHRLGVSRGRVQVQVALEDEVDERDVDALRALGDQRAERVPLQHLTGRAPFRGIELSVGPGVFTPRPETETVAQFAIDALRAVPSPEPIAVDLCTGSGAIALAMANELSTVRIWAVEKDPQAHAWAERNVAELGDGRVTLVRGDLRELDPAQTNRKKHESFGQDPDEGAVTTALAGLHGRVDVVVSNPPYVPVGAIPRDPEVREHDPEIALYSGEDGLDLIRIISRAARGLLAPGGVLVLEHAEGQGAEIRALLARDGWRAASTHRDLTGRDRATTALNASAPTASRSFSRGITGRVTTHG